ncbi:MAG: glycosyltransferase family 4 protein [Zoogloeaceae bacterium]|jgi:UDP-glucose:(heptosyl)LPS alpha-1,3-glucosyltransferase|nr:glycosyltransferase family 4 protein [Zoogloeaceae bacterium]
MPLLAFILYKYFPFGGLQRDFLRIAQECQRHGASIRVYTLSWQGDLPPGFDVRLPESRAVRALSNHRRYARFHAWVKEELRRDPVTRVVGFNKMPGLDVYYAADSCFEEKARSLRSPLYRLLPRYRHFSACERAVFAPDAPTKILLLSKAQQPIFTRYYATPNHRFHLLPPGVARDRRHPGEAEAVRVRAALRQEMRVADEDFLLLHVGSGFRTKGLDRSLAALAVLPAPLRRRAHLIAIGQDNPAPFLKQAKHLGVAAQTHILKGRDDIPRFLLGADVLLHPAYAENTGTVLLEALVAGLPVLVTDVCGYAPYIANAQAGVVLASPFTQTALNAALTATLADAPLRARYAQNALAYAQNADLYSMPEQAAEWILKA